MEDVGLIRESLVLVQDLDNMEIVRKNIRTTFQAPGSQTIRTLVEVKTFSSQLYYWKCR